MLALTSDATDGRAYVARPEALGVNGRTDAEALDPPASTTSTE
jgi:hypothetical protein